MTDSTNPRILANNIRKLFKKVNSIEPGTVVEGNPSGSGFNTLLTKIKIGSNKYKLPKDVTPNPEGEASDELTKLGIGSDIYSISGGSINFTADEFDSGMTFLGSKVYGKVLSYSGSVSNSSWTVTNTTISDINNPIFAFGIDETAKTCLPLLAWYSTSSENAGLNVTAARPSAAMNVSKIIVLYTKSES